MRTRKHIYWMPSIFAHATLCIKMWWSGNETKPYSDCNWVTTTNLIWCNIPLVIKHVTFCIYKETVRSQARHLPEDIHTQNPKSMSWSEHVSHAWRGTMLSLRWHTRWMEYRKYFALGGYINQPLQNWINISCMCQRTTCYGPLPYSETKAPYIKLSNDAFQTGRVQFCVCGWCCRRPREGCNMRDDCHLARRTNNTRPITQFRTFMRCLCHMICSPVKSHKYK